MGIFFFYLIDISLNFESNRSPIRSIYNFNFYIFNISICIQSICPFLLHLRPRTARLINALFPWNQVNLLAETTELHSYQLPALIGIWSVKIPLSRLNLSFHSDFSTMELFFLALILEDYFEILLLFSDQIIY